MGDKTGIQWTHVPGYRGATWNPTTGCTRVSPGCDHCYAFTLHDQRYKVNRDKARECVGGVDSDAERIAFARAQGILPMAPQYDVPFSTVQVLDERRLREPLRKRQPHAFFVDSMSDLFHEDVPDEAIDRVFGVMAATPQHIYQVLTKRPERMREYVARAPKDDGERFAVIDNTSAAHFRVDRWSADFEKVRSLNPREHPEEWDPREWPLPNVWLGVSVEDQQRADERIPVLLDTPAAVRFLSCEPLLGPVDLTDLDYRVTLARHYPGQFEFPPHPNDPAIRYDVLTGHMKGPDEIGLPRVDWVIVGGESGPHARPFNLEWGRSLVEQCRAAGVAVFVKQLGSRPAEPHHPNDGCELVGQCDGDHPLRLRHNHGGNPDEWPEDLRVREWPAPVAVPA